MGQGRELLFPASWAQGLPNAAKIDPHQQSAGLEIRCLGSSPRFFNHPWARTTLAHGAGRSGPRCCRQVHLVRLWLLPAAVHAGKRGTGCRPRLQNQAATLHHRGSHGAPRPSFFACRGPAGPVSSHLRSDMSLLYRKRPVQEGLWCGLRACQAAGATVGSSAQARLERLHGEARGAGTLWPPPCSAGGTPRQLCSASLPHLLSRSCSLGPGLCGQSGCGPSTAVCVRVCVSASARGGPRPAPPCVPADFR